MLKRIVGAYSDRFLSRWLVLLIDLVAVGVCYLTASLLLNNFHLDRVVGPHLAEELLLAVSSYAIGFLIAGSYSGIIRHTGQQDGQRILQGASIALALIIFIDVIGYSTGLVQKAFFIPFATALINYLLVLFALVGSRLSVKLMYHKILVQDRARKVNVLIYGAGTSGMITKQTLDKEPGNPFNAVGFIDDNQSKVGKALLGVPVYSPSRALNEEFLSKLDVKQIILSIQKLTPTQKREIVDRCLELNLRVKVVPPVDKWIQGELSARQIKSVRIEDLLQREPIRLDSQNIEREIRGKIILVSGAAGSIGSEIARQVLHYKPEKVILLDQAESPLYELQNEVKTNHPALFERAELVIGSVSDPLRMRKLFHHFRPEIVFHAAAYKHVPLMEDNPYEAVKVNVLGTRTLADLSVEFGAEKFVMISTDKAVNPTNVMGASKRVAELYTQSLIERRDCKTQFITTRFGNVLGSNGSVIPVFRKQIEKGGPITITHKDITRFFMTIPEACNLVLEAGAMGNGGEIFVFDMGESVKIIDLARKMIKLSGLEEGKDIEIKFVGLRPGEKLYEELLTTKENTKETHHPKIMIANVNYGEKELVESRVNNLVSILNRSDDNYELVKAIKTMVPEYRSNNSIYSSLDLKEAVNN